MNDVVEQLRREVNSLKESRLRGASSINAKSWDISTTFSFQNDWEATKVLWLVLKPKNESRTFMWSVTHRNMPTTCTFWTYQLFYPNTNTVKVAILPLNSSSITATINPIITVKATDELTITTSYDNREDY